MASSFYSLVNAMACNKVKCKIRSHLLNISTSTSSQSLWKVDLVNGTTGGVSVTGRNSDSGTTGKYLICALGGWRGYRSVNIFSV